jgi:O-methyltransferase involved in polyketide biosynthesis
MMSNRFVQGEIAAALFRGIRQFVFSQPPAALPSFPPGATDDSPQVFVVGGKQTQGSDFEMVPKSFDAEPLCSTLKRSSFDQVKSTLFVLLGQTGSETLESTLANLSFIASLPKGSGVLLDYTVDSSSSRSRVKRALDALSTCLETGGGAINYLIQPQAVRAMLRGQGFRQILDVVQDHASPCGARFVSATL